MAEYTGEFNEIVEAQKERLRKQDYDDLQAERGGYDTGRIKRFLSPEAREAARNGRQSGDKHSSRLSALDLLLLNDPEFARAYRQAMDALIDTEDVLERALETALAKAAETQRAYDELMDRAMRLPDGRAVFRDQLDVVREETGSAIDPTLAETLEWQGYEPSYEDFDETRKADEEADAAVLAIRGDQAELGEIRQELTDADNPPTTERVHELNERIDQIGDTHAAPIDEPDMNNETSLKIEPIVLR